MKEGASVHEMEWVRGQCPYNRMGEGEVSMKWNGRGEVSMEWERGRCT